MFPSTDFLTTKIKLLILQRLCGAPLACCPESGVREGVGRVPIAFQKVLIPGGRVVQREGHGPWSQTRMGILTPYSLGGLGKRLISLSFGYLI